MRILMLSWEYPPHVVGGLGSHVAELLPALARAGAEVHLVTPRWKGGSRRETVKAGERTHGSTKTRFSQSAASGRSDLLSASIGDPPSPPFRKRKEKLGSATVYRVPVPEVLTNDFFVDAQATNALLEKQCELLWRQVGGFDLIHAHDWLVGFAAANLKRGQKTPLVSTIHATERGRGRGGLGGDTAVAINNTEWWLTYESWRVITTSAFMANEVKSYFQTPADKVDIVPNGIDASRFDLLNAPRLKAFRAKWAAKDERIVIFVGRLVHEKGAQLIVEAAPRVLRDFPQTRFIIAGTGMMQTELKRRGAELGVGDRLDIAGFVSDSDRDKLLKVADVAVFPSLYEPFGIVALEAMAAKCPVVVSTVGGLAEVVTHNETGLTVYPDSSESLAWGILHTLHRPDWARGRAANAYRMVKKDYNWDRIATLMARIYARVVEERKTTNW